MRRATWRDFSRAANAEPQEFTAVSVKGALWLAIGFGLLKYVLSTPGQLTIQHAGYGIFRDELYFIVCGRHLALFRMLRPRTWRT